MLTPAPARWHGPARSRRAPERVLLADLFLLRRLSTDRALLPPDGRAALRASLEESRAHREQAQSTWDTGHAAQALLRAVAAAQAARAVRPPVTVVHDLDRLVERATALGTPPRDVEMSPAHLDLVVDLLAEHRRFHAAVEPLAWTDAELLAVKTARTGLALLAVAVVLLLAVKALLPPAFRAEASGVFGNDPRRYGAPLVVDGRPETEWMLPDRATGWVELRARSPRDVRRVRLLNAHNAPYNDRATREWRVELFAGERVVAARDGIFNELAVLPAWQDVDLPGTGVDRVRVTVRSFHGNGAGLAEVSVE